MTKSNNRRIIKLQNGIIQLDEHMVWYGMKVYGSFNFPEWSIGVTPFSGAGQGMEGKTRLLVNP